MGKDKDKANTAENVEPAVDEIVNTESPPAEDQTDITSSGTEINDKASEVEEHSEQSNINTEVASKPNKNKVLIYGLSILAVIIVILFGYLAWYNSQDHSIYSKLKTENYKQSGYNVSFSYPKVFIQQGSSPVFGYSPASKQAVEIAFSVLPSPSNLGLTLSSSEFINQVLANSGSYINSLNKAKPGVYNIYYNGCNNVINTKAGKALLCTSSYIPGFNGTIAGITDARIILPANNNIYTLSLIMQNNIWTAHQKVWQKIENSLN